MEIQSNQVTERKLALCIRRAAAPANVRQITSGTHRLPVTEEFFSTPVELQDRATCETDPEFLQLLPYVVLRASNRKVFRYFRGKGGTENRLHGRISVGLGGHMEQIPVGTLYEEIKMDATREILEEIGLAVRMEDIKIVGLIYNPVGVNQVHLAIHCELEVSNAAFDAVFEEGVIEKGEFVDPLSLLMDNDWSRMEDWSKAVIWGLASSGNSTRTPE